MTRNTIPIAVQNSIDSGSATLAWIIRITRVDNEFFAFTSADRPKLLDTDTSAQPGLDVQSIAMSAGFAVDNTEIDIVPDEDQVTRADILAGRWDAAAFSLSVFNWKLPTAGDLVVMSGTIGEVKPRNGIFVAELRDLRQAIQQDTTDVVQADCRYRLGDAKCTVAASDITSTGSVTGVTSRYQFADSTRTEVDDWFGAGEVMFTSGLNSGIRLLVRSWTLSTKTFVFALPAPFTITPGDTYTAIAGCRKRALADCRDKFNNIINFGGEPDKARIDALLAGAA